MAATLVLTLAQFPAGANPSQVPADAIWYMGLYYVPTILALWMAMMGAISTYRLDRAEHEDNLRRLAARRASAENKQV
jgi:Na+/melibiose symporter-like transporter